MFKNQKRSINPWGEEEIAFSREFTEISDICMCR